MNRLSLAQRIQAVFFVTLLALVAVAFVGYRAIRSIAASNDALVHEDIAVMHDLEQARHSLITVRLLEKDAVLNLDIPPDFYADVDAWKRECAQLERELGALPATGRDGADLRAGTIEALGYYRTQMEEVFGKIERGDIHDQLGAILTISRFRDRIEGVEARLGAEFGAAFAASRDRAEQADHIASTRPGWILFASAVAIVLAAGGGYLLLRSIIRPIRRAVDLAERIAQGDLTQRVTVDGSDEVATMLDRLNRMSGSLSEMVELIRGASNRIQDSSAKVASGNANLVLGSERQNDALRQSAGAIEEIKRSVAGNVQRGSEARACAGEVARSAHDGGEVMREVVDRMGQITDSSRRVAEVISIIDGIAFQTNILALNASVESARAGEMGRGFGVVATEVRTLAQRSSAAAREIRGMIEQSVQAIEAGETMVRSGEKSMQAILGSVHRLDGIIDAIVRASEEQSAEMSQIGSSVDAIDRSTRTNSDLVTSTAHAASDLQVQARTLEETIQAFRLPGSDPLGQDEFLGVVPTPS